MDADDKGRNTSQFPKTKPSGDRPLAWVKRRVRLQLSRSSAPIDVRSSLILQEIKPSFQFSFLIIVEPMLSPNGTRPMDKLRLQLVKIASERRDVWSNRAVAQKELGQRNAKAWHPRVLELYAVS